MSFKLSNGAKDEIFIDVRENDKDVREIDLHQAEAPALSTVAAGNPVPALTLLSGSS